ncbi:MAG: Crp/Fnr family transcriptional regulator [Pyrinomonadaceae bacterium]
MIEKKDDSSGFNKRLLESLQLENHNFSTVRLAKRCNVYVCGDPAEAVFFIESGQVKLLMPSPHGKDCLVAVHTVGDMFGELCVEELRRRKETAMVMEAAVLKRIPRDKLFLHLSRHSLVEGFVQYLAARLAEQQRLIGTLLMVNSEQRLGETLLALARKLGQPDPRSTRIEQKITHEELSEMVGTTRPRITRFMLLFRTLGLIEITPEHFMVIKEKKLADYLARVAWRAGPRQSREFAPGDLS